MFSINRRALDKTGEHQCIKSFKNRFLYQLPFTVCNLFIYTSSNLIRRFVEKSKNKGYA